MDSAAALGRIAIIGAGRMGTALAGAFREAGLEVTGPLGRGADGAGSEVVLLSVPDRAIAEAAAVVPPRPGLLVGHCSGATTLAPLAGHEGFSLHPLMTAPRSGARFTGATAAVDGSTPRALEAATALATSVGMRPVQVQEEDRAAYHASAAVASNFLTTVLDLAEALAGSAGVERERLRPIVQAAVDNWSRDGGAEALTGPVARGDDATVARHREAVARRRPEDLELFDALVAATRRLANRLDQGPSSV
ncbi:Rossmann-like and DUF2520 domain-containing protein [Ornithinicoccus hortensis]|uniref:Putative short-subunit dehydrogenase-like oxidoreductase (DUF2520 family) n=1 Tax=Ornithinicoccus hortensis TaxID=82346 RepID=A0A542YN86_9MICO|nr:Rossmann-like and DUF2520 domain-containing protein [Ornithinicoccus hortensis]TQL49517.1 putative short-subunit dehydrogenase-like oxidoreductase (DUF2520 family) [Ornithinicoccus hortensis]